MATGQLSDAPTRTSPEPLTEAGVAMGTVSYMSPEQARGEELDHRTDLFSLGAVLYEMATGQQPFAGNTAAMTHDALLNRAPSPPVTLNPALPAELQTVILKCLEKDPDLRYQSAVGLRGDLMRLRRDSAGTRAVATPATRVPERRAGSKKTVLALAAIGLLALAVAVIVLWPREEAVTLTETDPILLTAFENRTGDPVFDETLQTALAVKIDETPFLNVVPEQRVREMLELMQREPTVRLDEELGGEVCRRLNLKAMIHGEIAALGEQYVLTLHTLGCADGETLARVQEEATGKEAVLAALGEASRRLREDLGESLQSVAEFDTPIEQATTGSLEALEAYSRGMKIAETLGDLEAFPHLERAVELDPSFAMAHRKISLCAELRVHPCPRAPLAGPCPGGPGQRRRRAPELRGAVRPLERCRPRPAPPARSQGGERCARDRVGAEPEFCCRIRTSRITSGGSAPVYALIEQAYDPVKGSWEERFERSYGRWRSCVDGLVWAFLDCGDLERGFARVVCDA